MSWSERSVRYHKRKTDCAIHHAYARLAADARVAAKFHELLHQVRHRAGCFLNAAVVNGHHPAVEALIHLARFESAHIRPVSDWSGTTSSWRVAVSSLANHLVCKYEAPFFLASSWYATDDHAADKKRSWFITHGSGVSFRMLNLPIRMTSKMEHIFLASPDHLAIAPAMLRAELLALGATAELVLVVLSTRLATDLTDGEFWRTVWHFLIANAGRIDPSQIAPLIDFIQAIRHGSTPAFCMKGRTVHSMLRLMEDWHRSLGLGGAGFSWTPSPFQPMLWEEPSSDDSAPPKRWQMIELTSGIQLRTEGAALHHCVASYANACRQGISRIWSLRFSRGENLHHVMTIEIDPKRQAIVQARGRANAKPYGKPLRLLQDWAARERLRMAI